MVMLVRLYHRTGNGKASFSNGCRCNREVKFELSFEISREGGKKEKGGFPGVGTSLWREKGGGEKKRASILSIPRKKRRGGIEGKPL